MGKKSKRNKANKTGGGGSLKKEEINNEPREPVECPEDGWAMELVFAENQIKSDDNPSASSYRRIAVAASQLRQWDKCLDASSSGLDIITDDDDDTDDSEDTKKQLLYYQKRATSAMDNESGSLIHDHNFQEMFDRILGQDLNLDYTRSAHPTFNNLNVLHFAAMVGDLPLLEKLVALGAALDFPVLEDGDDLSISCSAPAGCTALVLVCSLLAMYGKTGMTSKMMTKEMRKESKGNEECAIALVYLGANCQKLFPRPHQITTTDPEDPLVMLNSLGLLGKTAKDLAIMSGRSNLIKAMEEMEQKNDRFSKAHCRCGSRIPWRQCHAGNREDHHPLTMESKHDKEWVDFRYSPMAPCPCKHKAKPYWRCCWEQTAQMHYQDDATGELHGKQATTDRRVIEEMCNTIRRVRDSGGDENSSLFPEMERMSKEQLRSTYAMVIRLQGLPAKVHPNSKMDKYDEEVYAGCVERIDNFFLWNDIHWRMDKTELKIRVKEWNTALEQYCDDMGLSGLERQAVIEQNKASPCGPCAHLPCNAWETKAKEFKRCSRCKSVAYCSVNCQRKAWKQHKKECVTAGEDKL